jgi:hypothetical protein
MSTAISPSARIAPGRALSNTTFLTRSLPIVVSLAALLLCAGCSAVSGGIKAPANLPSGPSAITSGKQIGSVAVSLDAQNLTPEVTQVAESYEVTRILDNRVREQRSAKGMASGGSIKVDVKVIGMRLRSNGTAIWWGFMAGGDWITVDVSVSEKGRPVKNFQTGTGTALGGFIYGGRSTRVGRMMKTLSERIADGI